MEGMGERVWGFMAFVFVGVPARRLRSCFLVSADVAGAGRSFLWATPDWREVGDLMPWRASARLWLRG